MPIPGRSGATAGPPPAAAGDRSRAAAAGAAVLDPVENIPASQAQTSRKPGHWREQYRAAAQDGIWGTDQGRCGVNTLLKVEDSGTTAIPVLCDTWSCSLCGPRKAAWFKRELAAAQVRHGLNTFMTLTVSTRRCSPEQSTTLIKGWWALLLRRLKHRYGPFHFIWTVELTKQGYAHLHLLTALPMTVPELRKDWRDITGGSWVVNVEPVSSDRAGDYIAKYCTEQAALRAQPGFEHLIGKRFFSKSRGITFEPFRPQPAPVELLDHDTGELALGSPWRRDARPFWVYVRGQVATGNHPIRLRLHGCPAAVFRPPEASG